MVGTLLKILHCKQHCQKSQQVKKRKITKSPKKTFQKFFEPVVQIRQQNVCRVCLKEGDVPIYGGDKFEDVSEALSLFGGITIQIDDSYPQHLCNSCSSLLNGAIILRKTAQESEERLKQLNKKPTASDDESTGYAEDEVEIVLEREPSSSHVDNGQDASQFVTVKVESCTKEPEPTNFKCKRCDLDFSDYKQYIYHLTTEDHKFQKRTCPICKKEYTSLYYPKHLLVHKREALYVCDICGKNFFNQGHFSRHRLTHFYHLPFKCSLCPYRGRFSCSLRNHMKSHTGEKAYVCSICAHRFVNKSNLNKHMLTHKGEHDFICASCGRGYYKKRDLEMHLKIDHAGIKEHVCNLCGKAFGYRKQMMKHQLKVHKREKLRSGRMPLYLVAEQQQNENNAERET